MVRFSAFLRQARTPHARRSAANARLFNSEQGPSGRPGAAVLQCFAVGGTDGAQSVAGAMQMKRREVIE
jgi:hypothetical protein